MGWSGWSLLLTSAQRFSHDDIPRLGAALAFYAMLSLGPLLALVLTITGSIFGRHAATDQIQQVFGHSIGDEGMNVLRTLSSAPLLPDQIGIAGAAANLILLFVGATGIFNQIQHVFDLIWRSARPKPKTRQDMIFSLIKERGVSFLMVLAIGLLLAFFAGASAFLSATIKFATGLLPQLAVGAQIANVLFSFGVMSLIFAVAFKIIPHAGMRWRDVWTGALLTAALFAAGQIGIGFYLAHTNLMSGYGAAGSLVALLIWFYYMAQIFFFGAEFTYMCADRSDSNQDKNLAQAIAHSATSNPGSARQNPVPPASVYPWPGRKTRP